MHASTYAQTVYATENCVGHRGAGHASPAALATAVVLPLDLFGFPIFFSPIFFFEGLLFNPSKDDIFESRILITRSKLVWLLAGRSKRTKLVDARNESLGTNRLSAR